MSYNLHKDELEHLRNLHIESAKFQAEWLHQHLSDAIIFQGREYKPSTYNAPKRDQIDKAVAALLASAERADYYHHEYLKGRKK